MAALAIKVYSTARDYAAKHGIIIADTKFEFGVDEKGEIGMCVKLRHTRYN